MSKDQIVSSMENSNKSPEQIMSILDAFNMLMIRHARNGR